MSAGGRPHRTALPGVQPTGPGECTWERFFEAAARHPERTALVYLGTRFTFGWLRQAVDRMATALARLGTSPGDRVLLYLPNTPEWVVANFAVQRLGAAVVPVSPIYTAHELRYMVEDAEVDVLVCMDTNFGYVQEILDGSRLRHVIWTTLVDLLPAWKRALGHALDRVPRGRFARAPRVHRFRTLLARTRPDVPRVQVDPWHDLATILYTGGTTAFPKGVPGNHMTEVAYVRDVVQDVFAAHQRPAEDCLLMVTPLYHIMPKGFFLAAGLNVGTPTVLMPAPHTDALLAAVERHLVSWFLGVPTLYRRILENDRLERYRLDSLRVCYCGGDVLPVEVFRRWRALTGAPLYQVYGSTEVGHVTYSRLEDEARPGTIGKPLATYRVRVADPETLAPVPTGGTGELLVHADVTAKGYWNKPAETAAAYVEADGRTWYRMGDFVRAEPDGSLSFVERTADVIKHKGLRVSASEVEAVLQDHPCVVAACVVGVEDPEVGERIKALVVLREDTRGVAGAELQAFCRERLAAYKIPAYVEFRDMLPKSKVGKLLRREIRDEERRR